MLKRKEAETSKGENVIEESKEFYLLKSDARVVQYFIYKFDIDEIFVNLKTGTCMDWQFFCLEDLLPFF